ncbi:hypothetical protein ACIBEJ_00815 [Nonomuraea sp. NPDC050790]|uniref:hypothetical protein n=1 Tax=Nonomuraea sp. NPDC050790 TaxID=3364371 RepID=UPI00379FC756
MNIPISRGSHRREPRRIGNWCFKAADDTEVNPVGLHGEVTRSLPAGSWTTLP